MNRKPLLIVVALLGLAGCTTLAPDYTRPAAPVSAAWPSGPAYKESAAPATAVAAADLAWRDFFVAAGLRKVIELALVNNRDLRLAALTIEKTRAQYQIQRAGLFPTVNASGIGGEQRLPASVSTTGESMVARQYEVNLGFSSYELDFFGRIRSLKDQALEQYLASEQARRSTQITLVGEVANTYLTLAADRQYLKLAQDTLRSQEASYTLIQRRLAVGVSSELDLRQAQTRVEAARVDIARYIGRVAQDENALALLVGSPVPEEFLPTEIGNGYRAEGTQRRIAVRGIAAPPRHPAGREPAQGGQRQYRRGPGGVFPPDHADLGLRHHQQRALRSLRLRFSLLDLRTANHPADLRRRQKPGQSRSGRGRSPDRPGPI